MTNMKNINTGQRMLGVNFTANEQATIAVWAPKAKKVAVTLSDNTIIPLQKEEFGYWTAQTYKLQPGDLYKFVLNDENQFPDPTSVSQPEGVHGFSQALNLKDYKWSDSNWKNIPLPDYVLYELHTGTFTPEGTFAGIEAKLDYLKELGVNAIEIMPVAQFPGDRNWGYDGVFPYAVQDSYGGAEELKRLVSSCHKKGFAVVLDVVYNHLGPEGNYLGAYGHYFTDKYNTPWGPAFNFDDAWCDGVRRFFIENLLMWFRDFHIDAVRLDAVHAIKDFSPVHILQEMKTYVNQLMQENGRTHYLIVELDLNDTRFINPLQSGGFGMDAQWIDEFHHALRVTATGENTGYYSDFTGIEHLAKAYQDAYVYDGQYSPHRFKHFGIKAENNPGEQFIVFTQNHDQVGNRMMGERTSQLVSYEMQKLMAGAVMVSPFLPMLWMGEEYGESHPFQYFVSHIDPELAEAVRKGRQAEFAAFHAQGEAPDPVSEETFDNSKLQWDLLQQEPHSTLFRWYQTLIQLRREQPVMRHLDRKSINAAANATNKTLLLHRWHEDQHIICLMNFSANLQQITVPTYAGHWQKVLDSAAPEWKGPAAAPESVAGNEQLTLHPESLVLFASV